MEKETITTKQNYYINFLYDLLDMLRGTIRCISKDKKLNDLFKQLIDYIALQITLPCGGEIIETCLTIVQKKD